MSIADKAHNPVRLMCLMCRFLEGKAMSFDAVVYLKSLFAGPTDLLGTDLEENASSPAALVASGVNPDSLPADWRYVFEERAACMEYEGGLPRELAEAKALDETVQMMRQKP